MQCNFKVEKIPIFVVDIFTDVVFSGNTCAVCIVDDWPSDSALQNIAKQNLFAETAFIKLNDNKNIPHLRWFTVSQEVKFCGYGTIAAGYVYLNYFAPETAEAVFSTKEYGLLRVASDGSIYSFKTEAKLPLCELKNTAVLDAIGCNKSTKMHATERGDLLLVFEKENDVIQSQPNIDKLVKCGFYGYIFTSKGSKSDYVYRYFSPRMTGVWEDPVNGASQTVLVPYWAKELNKNKLHSLSVSTRGGNVYTQFGDDKSVTIGGNVSLYLTGHIYV